LMERSVSGHFSCAVNVMKLETHNYVH
jgi:hypothetical protein